MTVRSLELVKIETGVDDLQRRVYSLSLVLRKILLKNDLERHKLGNGEECVGSA
jgi:hypothetical protein